MDHRDLQNWEPTVQDMHLATAFGAFLAVFSLWVSALMSLRSELPTLPF